MTIRLEAELVDRCKIVSHVGHHSIISDERIAAGGSDLGPNPLELFLSAIASSLVLTCKTLAQRQNITVYDLKVTVEGALLPACLDEAGECQELCSFKKIYYHIDFKSNLKPMAQVLFLENVSAACPLLTSLEPADLFQRV